MSGFYTEFTQLEQFIPNPESFDPERDLIRIGFESRQQRLYVSWLGVWAIGAEDPTLPEAFQSLLAKQEYLYRDIPGVRIDKAHIGSRALFSLLEGPGRNLWRSAEPVTSLAPVRRTTRLRGNVRLM